MFRLFFKRDADRQVRARAFTALRHRARQVGRAPRRPAISVEGPGVFYCLLNLLVVATVARRGSLAPSALLPATDHEPRVT